MKMILICLSGFPSYLQMTDIMFYAKGRKLFGPLTLYYHSILNPFSHTYARHFDNLMLATYDDAI